MIKKKYKIKHIEPKVSSWDISDDIRNNLSTKVLNKIYIEAELRFNSTVDDISEVRKKAYGLIKIFISLLSVLITLYFAQLLKIANGEEKYLIVLYFINIVMLLYVIAQLVIIIYPNKIMLKGVEPKLMNYEGMASLDIEEQDKVYLFNSIGAVQEKIEHNEDLLKNKNDRLEIVIMMTTIIFIFTFLFELITKIF